MLLPMCVGRRAQEQGQELPKFPPLEDPPETPEQRKRREEKEQHEETKKRADYAKRELEALQLIVELQRTNAMYPMGRDRQYRRYWLFSSLPAFMVEDHELFVSPCGEGEQVGEDKGDMPLLTRQDKGDMPLLMRQEDLNTSSDKENELGRPVSSAAHKVNGSRDEDCVVIGDGEEAKSAQKAEVRKSDTASDVKAGKVVDHMISSDRVPSEVKKESVGDEITSDASVSEPKTEISNPSEWDTNVIKETSPCDIAKEEKVGVKEENSGACIEGEQPVDSETLSSVELELPKLESSPLQLLLQQQQPRWFVVNSKDCLQQLMASLNPRGFRESALHGVLQDFCPLLNQVIDSCPMRKLCRPPCQGGQEEKSVPGPQVQTRASAPKAVEGTTHSDSASEAIELTLRDSLLDLEDRIFVGSLGSTKVSMFSVCCCIPVLFSRALPYHLAVSLTGKYYQSQNPKRRQSNYIPSDSEMWPC